MLRQYKYVVVFSIIVVSIFAVALSNGSDLGNPGKLAAAAPENDYPMAAPWRSSYYRASQQQQLHITMVLAAL